MRKGGHIVAKEIKQDGAWKQWLRSHECKDITPGEALSIINFKQAFECSIQEVRRTLDKCFECPHTHHTKTSEGFVIDRCSIATGCESKFKILKAAATHFVAKLLT